MLHAGSTVDDRAEMKKIQAIDIVIREESVKPQSPLNQIAKAR